jgi:hypothetical protein
MAQNKILSDGVQPTVATLVTLYTAPAAGGGTRIIAFTATNTNGTTDTYDLHIVPKDGAADLTNKIISAKSLVLNDEDIPAAVQNHLIPAGGTLEVKVSTATTIAFRATGIEF